MLRKFGEYALLALPAAAVAAVAFAMLVTGVPRPYASARLRGGPTEGVSALSFRLEAFERLRDREAPLSDREITLEVRSGGRDVTRVTGRTDIHGLVELSPRLPDDTSKPHLDVIIRDPARRHSLAAGTLRLTSEEWVADITRRGGWLEGQRAGELSIHAAPARGTFAVPFTEDLWVEVRREGRPVSRATVEVLAEGAVVAMPFGKETDPRGRLRVRLTPREHAVPVAVRASHELYSGTFDFTLPVLPGALRATLDGETLRIESPIERTLAYVSVVGEAARFSGAVVRLSPDGRGGSTGATPLTGAPSSGPLWAVVSSEPDTRSMARVGWPVRPDVAEAREPLLSFDVADRLLLDGTVVAARRDVSRQRRARLTAALFAACAMALTLVLLYYRARKARALLESHLTDAGEEAESRDRVASTGGASIWVVVIALLCVALGFAAVSLIATLG